MYKLSHEKRVQVLNLLVEGMSQRAVTRITGVSANTISSLVVSLGDICQRFHNTHVRGLSCKRVEIDELWAFCYARNRNLPANFKKAGLGDVWTWLAIDPDTKLIPCWYAGPQGKASAHLFLSDLKSRINGAFVLSSDGNYAYRRMVDKVFDDRIEFGILQKIYSPTKSAQAYPTPKVIEVKKIQHIGLPTEICTAHIERLNLTLRMSMRRLARQTNAFSKKLTNHRAAHAIYVAYYNYCRIHQSLRVTPAMAAGLSDRVWGLDDLVDLLTYEEMKLGLVKCG